MESMFGTPLRSAALGVLIVAMITLVRGVFLGRTYKLSVLVLIVLAICLVLISEILQ